jgi:hypothetical protein
MKRVDFLRSERPRDIYELIVPGLYEQEEDDPLRKRLKRYTPEEVQQSVNATLDKKLTFWKRKIDGCLLCVKERTVKDFKVLRREFLDAQVKKKVGEKVVKKNLSLPQRRLLANFFDAEGNPKTLCTRHLQEVFDVSNMQVRHVKAQRNKLINGEEVEEGEVDNDNNDNDLDDLEDDDIPVVDDGGEYVDKKGRW